MVSMSKATGTLGPRLQKQRQDETRYCENCGISFVWTREEQRQLADTPGADQVPLAPPLVCPGCRVLLAAAPRERGLVKWYHRRKGYGFVSRLGQPDLYVHRSMVEGGSLAPDDLIEFAVGANEQGPIADAVRVLDRVAVLDHTV